MNAAIVAQIGKSVFSIVKSVQAEAASADGVTKKEMALIVLEEVYNNSPLALTLKFEDAKADVEQLVNAAVAIYKGLSLFGFFKSKT